MAEGRRLRHRRARRWQRRLRLRAARGRTRQARRADREGQGRRHLPAPRLHPHQGAAARRRDRRPRRTRPRRSASGPRFDGIDVPGVNAYKDERGRPALEGPAVHHREPEDRHHRGDRAAGIAAPRSGSATRSTRARTWCWRPARSRGACPGWRSTASGCITSDHALVLDRVPASVVILGGGVIGVEFASVWRSFGAEVTIVEMLPHLLPLEDETSSKLLRAGLPARAGSRFELGAAFEAVKDTGRASRSRSRAARRSTPS